MGFFERVLEAQRSPMAGGKQAVIEQKKATAFARSNLQKAPNTPPSLWLERWVFLVLEEGEKTVSIAPFGSKGCWNFEGGVWWCEVFVLDG